MFELVDAAEAWGLDIVWLAEMLINPARSVLSAPLLVASWIAARTRHVRMGTRRAAPALNHQLRVAGEVTTLDHLSQGRFDFGIGRSGGTRGYDALGVPYEESQARFFEALEVILEAWKGEPFSYDGRFFRFTDVTVSPRPYQQPHPPVRMAATTADTFPRVGRMGCRSSSGCAAWTFPSWPLSARLSPGVARRGAPRRGRRVPAHPDLRRPDRARPPAKSRATPSPTTSSVRRTSRWRRSGEPGRGRWSSARPRPSAWQGSPTTRSSYRKVAFGTGPALVDRLGQLREELAVTGVAAELNPGGLLPTAQELRSLEILTKQVMPAFK